MSQQIETIFKVQRELGIKCPVPLVCPNCKESLHPGVSKNNCPTCVVNFKFTDGFPDLIVGERFDDDTEQACWTYEEDSNSYLTENFWYPILNKKFSDRTDYKPKVLSLGCGTGIDIDILTQNKFDAIGLEIGNRSGAWNSRKYPERFILANGMHMPFEDATFNAIYCGCVFPHVGVVGDSFILKKNYYKIRLKLAKEMVRVLKPGGIILVSGPNGNAPFDIFHGRKPGNYTPRYNAPHDKAIPNISDYKSMFLDSGASEITSMPTQNYWGFVRSKKSMKGLIFSLPIRFLFMLTSKIPLFRGSLIDPWIVVQIEKN